MTIDEKYFRSLHRQRRELLETLRATEFTRLAPHVSHQQVIPYASYSPWIDDADFQAVFEVVKKNTLVDVYRCHELWSLVQRSAGIPGDIVEVGVWRGGTAGILCAASDKARKEGRVFLFDTFQGVVKAVDGIDTRYKGGEHADTDVDVVVDLLSSLGVSNFEMAAGIFPDETGSRCPERVRLCHVDVDTYGSAKAVMEYVWPRLSPGGMLIFDDYGFWGCEGVTNLINNEAPDDSLLIHNLNGHGVLVKGPWTRADTASK